MRIEALKYRNENNQDIIIIVDFYDLSSKIVWRIADIKYKTSRQKIYRYFSETFCEDWDYRKLNCEERITYIMRKYEEFVGRDKIEEAVLKAWELLKPNLNEIDVVNV